MTFIKNLFYKLYKNYYEFIINFYDKKMYHNMQYYEQDLNYLNKLYLIYFKRLFKIRFII